jgi:integrase
MSDKLTRLGPSGLVIQPITEELREQAAAHKRRTHASETERAYARDWRRFKEWCEAHALVPLPAEESTLELYLSALARGYELRRGKEILKRQALRYSSISRAYSAIRAIHVRSELPLDELPGVAKTLGGLARALGTASQGKQPLLDTEVREAAQRATVTTTLQVRDMAILLVTFAAGLRRAEVSALKVKHVRVQKDGLVLHLPWRKNDQTGKGTDVGIPWGEHGRESCPVLALKAWLDRSGVEDGFVFRPIASNGRPIDRRLAAPAVSRAVKHAAILLGKDPTEFSAHSLRSGLATSAALAGKGLEVIMATTGHRSERVARGYIRVADVLRIAASRGLL